MTDIKSMNLTEMAAYFKELGEPAFRAKQVFQWLLQASAGEAGRLLYPLRAPGGAQAGLLPGRHHQVPVAAGRRKLY